MVRGFIRQMCKGAKVKTQKKSNKTPKKILKKEIENNKSYIHTSHKIDDIPIYQTKFIQTALFFP